MKDIPGKPNIIPHLIVPLPGSSQQDGDGGTGDVREGHQGGAQHECNNSNDQGEVQVQHDVLGDRGATCVQQQHRVGAHGHGEQQLGGHHDEDQGGKQVHVEFGMGQREVGQDIMFLEGGRVFLPGLEMGMVIP